MGKMSGKGEPYGYGWKLNNNKRFPTNAATQTSIYISLLELCSSCEQGWEIRLLFQAALCSAKAKGSITM